MLDPRYLTIARPRLLAIDDRDQLWVGSDGNADAPSQQGPGEIARVSPQGLSGVVHRGPVAAALGLGPGNTVFVADRHDKQIFVLTQDGKRIEFANFTGGDMPRSLGFAPVTPETRRAGVAGDLFVVTIKAGTWPVNGGAPHLRAFRRPRAPALSRPAAHRASFRKLPEICPRAVSAFES